MTSSMILGEKKWASQRRSGMTVLGKVAVPKPLNLPSQKLENHGLDPNVEIVPKGTLSWGSQSSSVPNAWGSSSVSPKASGRPSSGSGSRPSTAGSDRTQDPTSNAWGPSSRPSSASGSLASNQTALTSLRPCSADTRPGSSQLSRFAEPPPDNVATNKLEVTPPNNDRFSLSSGDFPTLGSEKESSGKNIDSQDNGYDSRPGSSSSRAASGKDKNVTSVGNVQSETTWARDEPKHAEYGVQPTSDKWHGDIPPGVNPHRPPQHFDAWHGPPMNRPLAGWYPGPPYGPPLHPSGFPMEPYPFYRPQMLPNDSRPVLPGGAPRGHHQKNGELCRPHGPEGFNHHRMVLNPGFYPAPLPYEGFYGPPMGYCNPNERGMPAGGAPPAYKRHPFENAIDSHSRSPVHGSRGKPSTPERRESRPSHSDNNRQYKVLLKHTNEWDEKKAEEKWDHGVPSNIPHIEKKDQRFQKKEWGLEDNQRSFPLDFATVPESRGKADTADSFGNKLENESRFIQPSQVLSAAREDSTLIQKIDVLNAKIRHDGRPKFTNPPCSEDRFNQPSYSSGTTASRNPSHGTQGRVDRRGKILNNQDGDGWRRKSLATESSAGVSVTNLEISSNVLVCDHHDILEESGKPELIFQGKDDGDHPTPVFDENDSQRAKMREIAKQRAEKLQKEEEERIREQKVKAMAKLEELNRRTHIAVASHRKLEISPPGGTAQQVEEKSRKSMEPNTDSSKSETLNSAVVQNSKDQIRASNSIMVGKNTVVFDDSLFVKPNNVHYETDVVNFGAASKVSDGSISQHKQIEYKQKQSLNSAKVVTGKSVPLCQTGAPNLKAASDASHNENIAAGVGPVSQPSQVTSSNIMTESSTHHRKKHNKNSKSKYRADDVAPAVAAPSTVVKETNAAKVAAEKPELDNLPQSKATVAKHAIHDLGKPQQTRRMPRNQQFDYKMGEREKSNTSDAVSWEPVRSEHKIEPMDRSSNESKPMSDTSNAKVDSVIQNNMKSKRAEMERYIPKPVAKELAQQGSIQQQVVYQKIDSTPQGTPTSTDVSPAAESKNKDYKQNKPAKAHGAWRQRGSAESASNICLQEAGKNIQKPVEQDQPLKSETDGWNSNDKNDLSAAITTAVTDGWGVPSRGNRYPFKGHRNMGNNFDLDHGDTSTGPRDEILSESAPPLEINQMDKNLKENRFGREQQTSQWQPKNQVYSVHNRRSRQMDAPANKTHIDQSHSEPVNVEEAHDVVHQDFKRERNPASSFRGRPHSPNVNNTGNTSEVESRYVKNVGQYRNQKYQSGRSHESRGYAPPFNRERPRQSPHFEYQPVGQYGNNKPSNMEGSTDGSQNMGSRYKERNQSQPRRGGGNFYGRDARYE